LTPENIKYLKDNPEIVAEIDASGKRSQIRSMKLQKILEALNQAIYEDGINNSSEDGNNEAI
jgi:hypothetical protein